MPNLKKLILYTDRHDDFKYMKKITQNEKQFKNIKNLDISLFGFKNKRIFLRISPQNSIKLDDDIEIKKVFDNYCSLIEAPVP